MKGEGGGLVYNPVNKAFILKYTPILVKREGKGGRLVYVSVNMIWIYGLVVRVVCANLFWYAWFAPLIIPYLTYRAPILY